MSFWKDLALFNMVTSDDKNERLASAFLYATEEEKEQARLEKEFAELEEELEDEELFDEDDFDEDEF